eukprot:2824297-Rhodomonas_salina.5
MQKCRVLNGMKLETTPEVLDFIDRYALNASLQLQMDVTNECNAVKYVQICWESPMIKTIVTKDGPNAIKWMQPNQSFPWAFMHNRICQNNTKKGCSSDCLQYAKCVPERDRHLAAHVLNQCLNDKLFSLHDGPGCAGQKKTVVNRMVLRLPDFPDVNASIWTDENLLTHLFPKVAKLLDWSVVDIRPVQALNISEPPGIQMNFLHQYKTHPVWVAIDGVFHNSKTVADLRPVIREYVAMNTENATLIDKFQFELFFLEVDEDGNVFNIPINEKSGAATGSVFMFVIIFVAVGACVWLVRFTKKKTKGKTVAETDS